LITVLNNLLGSIVLAILWRQVKNRFKGILYWSASFACLTLGMLLLAIRGVVPEHVSVLAGNFAIFASYSSSLEGYALYIGKPMKRSGILILGIPYLALLYWSTVLAPNFAIRSCVVTAIMFVQEVRIVLLLRSAKIREMTYLKFPYFLHILLAGVSLARFISYFLYSSSVDELFTGKNLGSLAMIAYQPLLFALLIAEFMSVNRRLTEEMRIEEERIREMSLRDPLTNIFNRRYAFKALHAMIDNVRRLPETNTFAVAILDMDFFKSVNDRYGHLAGDAALQKLVEIASGMIRANDVLARYGGEEFLILFAGATRESAASVMRRMLETLALEAIRFEDHTFGCTFSCGVADSKEWRRDALNADGIVALADRRLLEAKRAGRSMVICD
jgi:diguanylate cyclase (GGDEF)-like protein